MSHHEIANVPPPGEGSQSKERGAQEPSLEPEGDLDLNWITGLPLAILMTGLSIVMFLVLLDSSIIGTATPQITSEFHSLQDVGWYGSAYRLASAVVQPLTGKIYSTLNLKWSYLAFFTIFEVGSLICGVARSSIMLIIGRAVAGIGVAGLQSGSLMIVATAAPLHRRATLNGSLIGISQAGIVMGPLIGGAFTTYSTWRWCFYINLPLGAIVAGCLFFVRIPQPKAPLGAAQSRVGALTKELDFLGFILLTGFSIELLLALEMGGDSYAWNSSVIIGLLCGAVVTLVAFLLWQYHKGDRAMIPFSVARKRVIWCGFLVYSFLMAALSNLSYYIPIYFQSVLNATAILSGVYMLPNIVAQVITCVSSGILVEKLGYYLPWSIVSIVLTTIGTGLMSTFDVNTSTGEWIGYQIIFGAGCGMGIQMPILAAQNSLAPSDIPVGIAILIFFQCIVSAVWLAVASAIFTNSLSALIPQYAPSVSASDIIEAGATGIRNVVADDPVLRQVLEAYSKAIDNTFYIAIASLGASIFFVWGIGWKDIRRKKEDTPPQPTHDMLAA
ncbi:MFS general substrate transporter [Hypoxylon sp. EC38]|nr:MFS general substrate transporter [Hypoxylon sp. EC38]